MKTMKMRPRAAYALLLPASVGLVWACTSAHPIEPLAKDGERSVVLTVTTTTAAPNCDDLSGKIVECSSNSDLACQGKNLNDYCGADAGDTDYCLMPTNCTGPIGEDSAGTPICRCDCKCVTSG